MEDSTFFTAIVGYLPGIFRGLLITIRLTIMSAVVGFLIALPMVILSIYSYRPIKLFISSFILIIKGTPLLVQLFFIYYGIPSLPIREIIVSLNLDWFFIQVIGFTSIPQQIKITPLNAATIGFIINSTCYQADYIRGGFLAISKTQMEAAYSIGLSKWGAIRTIMIPQALRFSIPALSNEMVYLLQYTSVAGIIQVEEFYFAFQNFFSMTYYYIPSFIILCIVYLFLIYIVTKGFDHLDKIFRIPGTGFHNQ